MNMIKNISFFLLLILVTVSPRLEFKSMTAPYLNVGSIFLQTDVLIMQYADVDQS